MKRRVAVVGAGPTGAFVAGSLAARGFEVHLFEKREDPWETVGDGRSIALSLSPRGLAALETIGLRAPVEAVSTELVGRAFHPRGGGVRVLETPAGAVRNRAVGRAQLSEIVGRWALAQRGVVPRFGEPCLEVLRSERALVSRSRSGEVTVERFDLVLGTDGAASEVRTAIVRSPSVDFGKRVSPWGYLEVTLDRSRREVPLDPPAIHIWPRESFFMVGFPARDATFRCTLVLRHGDHERFRRQGDLEAFLARELDDVWPAVRDPGRLVGSALAPIPVVRVGSWHEGGFMAILGDAAHATAPFMGQGVNIALEDARVLVACFDASGLELEPALRAFGDRRVAEGLACCDLSERAAHALLTMPDPRAAASPLAALNVAGQSYAEVARRFLPGWQPRVYAEAVAHEDGVEALVPPEILEPFEVEAGAVLTREGDAAGELLVLSSGVVRIASAGLGEVRVRAPAILGEVGWFGFAARTATATAETPCRGGKLPYARLEAFCASSPERALPLVNQLGTLAVERLKDRFHPRARYLVVVAYGELRDALEAWALSCREHLAAHPIACTAEVGAVLAASANVQPARVLPTLARGGHAALQGVVQGARALFWFRPEPLAPELGATLEARGVPLVADFEAASRFLERTHRAEREGAS